MLLYYTTATWLATCKPCRGILKRVCGLPSNCDGVWLLSIGSGTVKVSGKSKLHGQTSDVCLWLCSTRHLGHWLFLLFFQISAWVNDKPAVQLAVKLADIALTYTVTCLW